MEQRNIRDSSITDRLTEPKSMLNATSADIDREGKTYIVLYWKPLPGMTGYNIYRSRGRRPINGRKPVSPVQTCNELKAIIPEGSPEWLMLQDAFSSATVSQTFMSAVKRPKKAGAKSKTITAQVQPTLAVQAADILGRNITLRAIDPCEALERGLTRAELETLDMLANINLKIRLARGLAFIDYTVNAGQTYTYELRGIGSNGRETVLASGIKVRAGYYILPDPPSGFTVTPGDAKVLALWNRNPYAYSYKIRRKQHVRGLYQVINEEPIFYDISEDLDGNPIEPPRPGFVDFQRWSEDGLPVPHDVNGVSISGPKNYTPYYYQVASRDILGREGKWSLPRLAKPTSQTPPMAPTDFSINPNSPPGLALTWRKVTRDINNHQIPDTAQTYRIYRAVTMEQLEDIDALPLYHIHDFTADPTDPTNMTLVWIDYDPILVPPYGEKDFWYTIRCEDVNGNISAPSAILCGRVPDTTPPGPTEVTGADGHADHITVYWLPNAEPDLAGYQIYRGICDRGGLYHPEDIKKESGCGFVLVGEIWSSDAENMLSTTGRIYFDDYSVPAGSPICYAYWVRAFDASQNLYQGTYGCPASPKEFVCQRLYEQTPPPVPIITGLKARNNSVLIEWIASPIQDLRAFHIYRSDKEDAPHAFIGCVLIDGTVLPDKWEGIKPCCDEIPAELDPDTVSANFTDKNAEPNRVYWYRVSALDWIGNESEGADLIKIPAISTFTYTADLPMTPNVIPQSEAGASPSSGCGLVVGWEPPFDPALVEGFLVFRSTSLSGAYRQISPLVKGNKYSDGSAIRGTDYWYCVQAIDRYDKLSEPSKPVYYKY
jgi:hypothetical protein